MNPEYVQDLFDLFKDNGILNFLGNIRENKNIPLYEICKDRYPQAIMATLMIESYTEPPKNVIFLDDRLDWLVREQKTLIWIRKIIKRHKLKKFNRNKLSRQQSNLRLQIVSIKNEIKSFDLKYRLEYIQSLTKQNTIQNDNITPDEIINSIAKCFDIEPNDIKSPSSLEEVTLARKIAISLIYEYTNSLTQEKIGKIFNIATSWVSIIIKQVQNMHEEISKKILETIQSRIIGSY
jgi:chromosomal replication initiation ATPase DnaA